MVDRTNDNDDGDFLQVRDLNGTSKYVNNEGDISLSEDFNGINNGDECIPSSEEFDGGSNDMDEDINHSPTIFHGNAQYTDK